MSNLWIVEKPKPERCHYKVSSFTGFNFYQCSRKWTVELDGHKFCKQHAKSWQRMIDRNNPTTESEEP